jgi:hypothetical protein
MVASTVRKKMIKNDVGIPADMITALITSTGRPPTAKSGARLPSIKILFCICIKSGADALANLPNQGKVVPARGCGHFGNETGRA